MNDQYSAAADIKRQPAWKQARLRQHWRDRWSKLRNRLLASPRFRRWSSRFPPTRGIARKQGQALFDLCSGFVYSQVLFALVELRIPELLRDGPQPLPALARRLSLAEDRAAVLLDAAVALELLESRGGQSYGLGPLGAVLDAQRGVQAMIRHHAMLYEDLRDPLALLRDETGRTRLNEFWSYGDGAAAADLPAAEVEAYSELMAASQDLIAEEVLNSYSLGRHRCLLDVGGGTGTFLAAAASRWPHLQLRLFDLPAVVEQARSRMAAANLESRFDAAAGSFFADPLPREADVISLVRVVHDHNDADVLRLLRSIHASLPGDGALLLAEPMAGDKTTDKVARTYFGFYLLAMGRGRPRTPAEIGRLLREAGFRDFRLLSNLMPMQVRIMVAHP